MTENTYTLLEDRAMLTLSGEDSHAFLQGLISNDVDKISEGRAIYAALLTAQGKYLHDFFVFELDGSLALDCEKARIDDLMRRLRMYRLRAKIELDIPGDDWAVIAITGDASPNLARGVIYQDPRHDALGARAALPVADLADLHLSAGAREDYDALRLKLAVPESGSDLVPEKSLLMESGFEQLNGVDFEKGCYVGQEVTARMKYRALIRKRLFPVRCDGPAPAPGAPIYYGDVAIGEMRSSQGGRGMALLRIETAENADAELIAGDARIRVIQ
ncbi:MAG: folate-binding protein [Pseudomonadota bacterium]|nr:folate-binding protein [Pseudomonadota bacterium]